MSGVLTRSQLKQRTSLDIPNPEPGMHYRWAALNSGHPQSYARFRLEGYEIVPARDCEKLGLYGFRDPETQDEVTPSVNNCILFGNVLLMRAPIARFMEIVAEKDAAFDEIDPDAIIEQQKEALEEIKEEHKRTRRR